nr:MAG TPA: hypothetical protein [Caudoviricetes sp.]
MSLEPFITSFLAKTPARSLAFFSNATSIRKRAFHILFS